MTLTLDLTEEQEARLVARAKAAGIDDPRQYVLSLISSEIDEQMPTTGAELIAYWKRLGVDGLFADRPDSPEFARQLRSQVESRAATS